MASKHTAKNLLAAAFGSINQSDFQEARRVLERADREVRRLVEEGCDDPPDKKKRKLQIPEKLNPLAAWKKRQARLQLQGEEVDEEYDYDEPETAEEERKPRKMKKALLLMALPVLGAVAAPYVQDFVPEFDQAQRGEFRQVAACKSCEHLDGAAVQKAAGALCGQCGGSEFETVVAAPLTQKVLWWSEDLGWQLPSGETLWNAPDAEYEVPALKTKGTKKLTRF